MVGCKPGTTKHRFFLCSRLWAAQKSVLRVKMLSLKEGIERLHMKSFDTCEAMPQSHKVYHESTIVEMCPHASLSDVDSNIAQTLSNFGFF